MILYGMFSSFKWAILILAQRGHGAQSADCSHSSASPAHHFSVSSGVRFPRALRRLGPDRHHHARVHQPDAVAWASPREEAAIEGAVLRLRPIMMTMLVATLGSPARRYLSRHRVRLATTLCHGHRRRPGHARSLISVFLLPTLYVWIARDTDVLTRGRTRSLKH